MINLIPHRTSTNQCGSEGGTLQLPATVFKAVKQIK